EQAAGEPNRGGLAGTIRTDEPEHLAATDGQRQVVERAELPVDFGDVLERDRIVAHRGISASTGMPGLSTPSRLSAVTLMRYTSLVRSSAVCTLSGVNSALGEMKEIVPSRRCPASVTSVTFCPSFNSGTSGSST